MGVNVGNGVGVGVGIGGGVAVGVGGGLDTGAGDCSSIHPANMKTATIAIITINPVMGFFFIFFLLFIYEVTYRRNGIPGHPRAGA